MVATSKRIGSPAPANTKLVQDDWFYDFMSSITQKGSHVDFICLHHYASDGDVNEFQSYIESVYNMYKLPIWVTERAYVDYMQNPPKVPDDNTQVTYMQVAVKMLDSLSYVERYAWFALPESSAQAATNLFKFKWEYRNCLCGALVDGRGSDYMMNCGIILPCRILA